jgi:transposase
MTKHQTIQDDCKQETAEYQLVMPINVGILIPEDDSVRLLSQMVEELDLRDLILAYSPKGRNPAVPPRIMFKILVYAYMNRIYSSREIERHCKRDINFMWLLEGRGAPDHNTIARFRTGRLKEVIESLFNQIILKLHNQGEIQFENVFIDGTKIEANANKYSFVWKRATEKFDAKIPAKVTTLASDINAEFGTGFEVNDSDDIMNVLNNFAAYLTKQKEKYHIVFVNKKGHKKTELQRLTERTLELLEKKEKYQDYMGEFENRNSFSKTDRDATFMHMKEDHMRNAQLKPGYNFQIGVENGFVVGMDISCERSDMYTLIPMLDRLETNFPDNRFDNVVCDAGYESEENYNYIEKHKYTSFIKPANYESQKKRNYKEWIGRPENMIYDPAMDEYTCAKGRKLKAIGTRVDKRRRSKYPRELTIYQCENCNRCALKDRCKKSKKEKHIEVSKEFVRYRSESQANITSDLGIVLRINRSIQVEGAFGMIKEDCNFRRFLTRGSENVFIECMLMCFSYNINKLHNKQQGRGNKEILYQPKAA